MPLLEREIHGGLRGRAAVDTDDDERVLFPRVLPFPYDHDGTPSVSDHGERHSGRSEEFLPGREKACPEHDHRRSVALFPQDPGGFTLAQQASDGQIGMT